ncbi:DUF5949 family protein [Streptomyces tsukubensis]|uniref:Uncharacterized protein n=1 Tax=Streptomyces tsukubensis TaxID=83656 RepID=A0A1V4A474_9ACTN|nr:DUF5949 family protein [Streptomyces tsukubensis]OON75377.1 hypothetical protein B1H18_23120 [Streptomyces tsukubensis]QFR94993.1 hypothetical protein GBW32_20665 [Streptomyces tsukubensis]
MTSTSSAARTFRPAELGTLVVVAWSGKHPDDDHDMPFLLAYPLGDGTEGVEGVSEAARALLADIGLPVGGELLDGTTTHVPVTLLVEAGQAALTMPQLSAQCEVPPEWLLAAKHRGYAYFMFATRPWPQAVPGVAITDQQLAEFVGDEAMLTSSAHSLLPVRSLRG